jgi:alpha-N-arabinofuranosidase
LLVGLMLITILKNADRVKVACLAQLVNVIAPIMTRPGGGAWAQTIYWPLKQASALGRGKSLLPILESEKTDTKHYTDVPFVDAAAVLGDDGSVTIFAVNRDPAEALELSADLRDFGGLQVKEHIVLHHDDVKAVNTEEHPNNVAPTMGDPGSMDGGRLTIAHGFSREMINAHHEGAAHHVSNGLMPVEEMKALFEPWFHVDTVISNDEMYQVAGTKR